MKEAITGLLTGMALGGILIVLLVLVLSVQSTLGTGSTEGSQAVTESINETENFTETEKESLKETEVQSEDETMTEVMSELESSTESESLTETEVPSESESETEIQTEEELPTELIPDTEGEAGIVVEPEEHPYYIKVNRSQNCITIYGKDENGEYTVPIRAMICSVGTGRRTPLGTFKISNQYRWHALYMNSYGQYCSRIAEHILLHSIPYSKKSPSALRDGVYNALGGKASLGCIRLTVIDAKWIYENCPPGTQVEVYEDAEPGPLGKPNRLIIDSDSPYKGWDPTDPDENNPWKSVPITINGVVDMTVECGSEVDVLSHVTALDIDGNTPLEVRVSGYLDTNTIGTYTITYSAEGLIGTTATMTATVTVVPAQENMQETEDTQETETVQETGAMNDTGIE